MKQRIFSFFVCIGLLIISITGAVAAQENAPAVQIISVLQAQEQVDVVFFCQNPGEGQLVTVLCQRQDSAAEGEILYVGQWEDVTQGINRRSFPIDSERVQGSYVVTLGGDNIANPSSFGFTFGAAAAQGCMAIKLDITCAQLLQQLGVTQEVAAITVDGNALAPEDVVPAGAVLTLYMDSQEITTLLFIAGDIDGNRNIDAADALLALQHSVQLVELDGLKWCAADTNFDGRIDAVDALLILQYSVGLLAGF